jgi:hypothetical protein
METTENSLAAFRWEITLDVANKKDQEAQQYRDLNYIVEKKFNASDQAGRRIKSHSGKSASNQPIQPFHAENLILKKVPDCF